MLRRRFGWVLGSLLALSVLEIIGLVVAAKLIGVGWTLLLVLATTVLGIWLLRREGVRAWRRFRAAAESGPPGREATDGLVGLGGALLLVIPGFLTDLVGLLVLAPPVRAATRSGVQQLAERRLSPSVAGDLFGPRKVRVRPAAPSPAGEAGVSPVIEGEIVD